MDEEDATRGAMVIRQRQRREVSRQVVDESGKGSPKTRIPANYIKVKFSIGFKAHEVTTRAIAEVGC